MPDCPTPYKLKFESRWEARKAAIEITQRISYRKKGRASKGKRVSRRSPAVYECSCRGYHLATRRVMLTEK
jgi:hypothetical protein